MIEITRHVSNTYVCLMQLFVNQSVKTMGNVSNLIYVNVSQDSVEPSVMKVPGHHL